jgi:hypothetical protein
MIRVAAVVFCVALASVVQADLKVRLYAQAAPVVEAGLQTRLSGKDVLTRKCFQCHQASMWASVRGDRREWLGVLYRMVGRGALWTEEEINAMATFLAETRPINPKSQSPNPN